MMEYLYEPILHQCKLLSEKSKAPFVTLVQYLTWKLGCMFIAMYKHAQTQLNTSDRAKYQAESQGLLG